MRIYEEYESKTERNRAVRKGAKRGHPTGESRGYILVLDEDERGYQGEYQAVAGFYSMEPGASPADAGLGYVEIGWHALHDGKNRRVGFDHLPEDWQEAFARYMAQSLTDLEGTELAAYKKRYRKLWKHLPKGKVAA